LLKKKLFAILLMLALVTLSGAAVAAPITFTFTEFHAEASNMYGYDSQTTNTPPATASRDFSGEAWASTTGVSCWAFGVPDPMLPAFASTSAYTKLQFIGTFSQLSVEFSSSAWGGVNLFSLSDNTLGIQLIGVSNPGHFSETIALSMGHAYEISMSCSSFAGDWVFARSDISGLTLGNAPLPSTLGLLGSSLLGCFIFRKRGRRLS